MVGFKRKEAPLGKAGKALSNKKAKVESKSREPPPNLEVETDSDPIIESDTTEHSGLDDGASWPSDDDVNDDSGALLPVENENPVVKDSSYAKSPNVPSGQSRTPGGAGSTIDVLH